MGFEEEFATESTKLLKEVLLPHGAKLTDKIDELGRDSDDHVAYYSYLKDFLINSGCLCDDILQAAQNDAVLLAMIGTRTLLEDAINAHYLQSKTDEAARIAMAVDWFRITNAPEAYKNKVDGKTVIQRAEAAGADAKALYDGEYAEFCNYTHSTAQRAILNMPDQRSLLRKKTILGSLKAYANIVTCIAEILGEEAPKGLIDAVKSYLDKYRDSVMEAPLPPITDPS